MSTEVIVSEERLRAEEVHRSIKISMYSAKTAFLEIGKSLKQMRDDKLYKQLNYHNFEEYCEAEVEISRRHAYNLISIVENLPEDFVHSVHKIGVIKLATLATLPFEQAQEVVEHIDVESVTVKELKAEVAALRHKNEELSEKAEQVDIYAQQFDDLSSDKKKAEDALAVATEKNRQLSEQVEELKNRPVEVAVSTEEAKEIENLKSVLKQTDLNWSMELSKKEDEFTEIRREDYRKAQAELAAVREEYEQKLAEAQSGGESEPDTKEIFKAYLANAIDAVKRMTAFLADHPNEACRAQAEKFFTAIMQEVKA